MVKVIETNITKLGDVILDHQSRMCEYLSWRDFKKQFLFHGYIIPKKPISYIGMPGYPISENANITKLKHDENKLYCEFNVGSNSCVFLAYKVGGERNEI